MLSPEVLAQVERLGGTVDATQPGALAQLFAIRWPGEYDADENGPCWWARQVYFHAPQDCDRVDFGFDDRGDMDLVRFCHARGRSFIMLDRNDPDPSDPLVYHASSGTYTPTLGSGIRLSAFLRALAPRQ